MKQCKSGARDKSCTISLPDICSRPDLASAPAMFFRTISLVRFVASYKCVLISELHRRLEKMWTGQIQECSKLRTALSSAGTFAKAINLRPGKRQETLAGLAVYDRLATLNSIIHITLTALTRVVDSVYCSSDSSLHPWSIANTSELYRLRKLDVGFAGRRNPLPKVTSIRQNCRPPVRFGKAGPPASEEWAMRGAQLKAPVNTSTSSSKADGSRRAVPDNVC